MAQWTDTSVAKLALLQRDSALERRSQTAERAADMIKSSDGWAGKTEDSECCLPGQAGQILRFAIRYRT